MRQISDKGPGISKWYLGTRLTPEHAMKFAIFALLNVKIPKTHSFRNHPIPWKQHAYAVLKMHVIDAGLLGDVNIKAIFILS